MTSLLLLLVAWVAGEVSGALDRLSIVSAYLFLLSLGLVLLIGPWRAVLTGRATFNHTLRRDVAIWAAIAGFVHLIAGAMQSMTPEYLDIFITHAASPPPAAMREAFFLWATIVGFVIGILLIILLAVSNNRSVMWVGPRWWKRLHRLSYVVFVLTIVHGLGFQILESRSWGGYGVVAMITLVVCIAQGLGARAVIGRSVDH